MQRNEEGLSSKEVKDRLSIYGKNVIQEHTNGGALKILFRQIKKNFVIYLLIVAMSISFFVGKKPTAYVIMFVIILVIVVGFFQEYRAERAVQALRSMITPVSIVVRNGKEVEIPSSDLVPGDILILRTGERIPADCFLIEQHGLLMNESLLTGESKEIAKSIQEGNEIKDSNTLFMGTFIVNGRCVCKVINTGMNTKFGKISKLISLAEKELPLQKKLNTISKLMVITAIVFSILTGLLMLLQLPNSETVYFDILILIIALSVAAFPEAIPVVLITSLSIGAYKMAKKNAIVNRMSVIESLGETTVICSDKTGTITKGEMTVSKIFADGSFYDVTGTGFEGVGDFLEDKNKIDISKNKVLSELLKASLLCNDSRIERTGEDMIFRTFGSPTESALLILGAKAKMFKEDMLEERLAEIAFNSNRKMMTVLCKGKETNVYSKGAPEQILSLCNKIFKEGKVFTLTKREKERILQKNRLMTSDALRTVAMAYKPANSPKVELEKDLIFIGIVGMQDPPREEVKEAIQTCFTAGIAVKMITGDHSETALSIAKKIGLDGRMMTGSEMDSISDRDLVKIVRNIVIFARVKPEHKIRIVRALKEIGEVVTMTGDGVNDAPALKEAHIGVAMGKNGTDVSRSVADLTLKDDNFATIVHAIREGRTVFKNIRKFISYLFSCSFAELILLLFGVILAPYLGWQIPILLALHILFMNMVTSDMPALTLSLTPSSDHTMLEKPKRNEQIITFPIFSWFVVHGAFMAIITLLVFYLGFNVWNESITYARTLTLLTLIMVEIANAYCFMSYRLLVTPRSLLVNKPLLYASIASITLTLMIIYLPINSVFETTPLEAMHVVYIVLFSLLVIGLSNTLKYFNNKDDFFKLGVWRY